MAISDDDDDRFFCFDCERRVSVSMSEPVPVVVYIVLVRGGEVSFFVFFLNQRRRANRHEFRLVNGFCIITSGGSQGGPSGASPRGKIDKGRIRVRYTQKKNVYMSAHVFKVVPI